MWDFDHNCQAVMIILLMASKEYCKQKRRLIGFTRTRMLKCVNGVNNALVVKIVKVKTC